MTDTLLIQSAADILAARYRQGSAGPRLPESCRPDGLDAALAIQEKTTGTLGARIGGWKCGTPGPGKLVSAPIYADRLWRTSPCGIGLEGDTVRIEPELAFILARDLPPRATPYSADDIAEAVGAVHLALEIIGSRFARPGEVPFVEHLADRLLNHGLFIGPEVDAGAACAAVDLDIEVAAGERVTHFDGQHPDRDPLLPLLWLANFQGERGRGLKAGEAVITGTYVPSFEVPRGQDVAVSFGSLGRLRVRFGD